MAETESSHPTPNPTGHGGEEDGFPAMIPYLAPMFAFLTLTSMEGYLGDPAWYPAAYTAKVVIVALVAWHYRSAWKDLRPAPGAISLMLALMSGILVFALWVGLDPYYPALEFLGKRTGFDPTPLPSPIRTGFIGVRLVGLVVLVPLIEELFWRSFLIRYVINPDHFSRVPIGRVTPLAAAVSSVLFAMAHPEWLPAVLTGLIWAGLLHLTRSLSACAVSHAVANLALGIYVLGTGDWKYW